MGSYPMFKYADYIYEIYKEKSFTKAANNLFISQPALSAAVRKVEEELQIKIFDRSASPLALTLEGEAYIKAVKEMYNIKKDYENNVIDLFNLNVGSIRISGANFISSYVIPKIILPFSKKYPTINIELLESNSKTLINELTNDNIDLLIDYSIDEKLIESYPLFNETILLCVPKQLKINSELLDYSLNSEDIRNDVHFSDNIKKINLYDFKNENFLMLKSGNSMNNHGFDICHESGFDPKVSIYFDQLVTSYNMASSGLGVCFVTDTLIKEVPQSDTLLYYKLDSKHVTRTVYILHKKRGYINRLIKEFINVAIETYKSG